MKVANLALRFLLELAALGGLAYWGFHEFDGATDFAVFNGVVVRKLNESPALDSAG